ncbi:MAG: hypothetical protein IPP49_07185 [Saprospiraceae bacterium]|nr:hypothetical protein [Saprospiraceae bacterium]
MAGTTESHQTPGTDNRYLKLRKYVDGETFAQGKIFTGNTRNRQESGYIKLLKAGILKIEIPEKSDMTDKIA